VNRHEFNAHCSALTWVVMRRALDVLKVHGFDGVVAVDDPPASFDGLRTRYSMLKHVGARLFPVLGTHCDDVIYDTPHVNMLYRGWHDLTHIELNRGFGYADELIVARHKSLSIPEGPMRDIMLADAVGESQFANATGGKFPRRQRDWAFDYVNCGFAVALEIHRHDTA
jgi:hypothetical protein